MDGHRRSLARKVSLFIRGADILEKRTVNLVHLSVRGTACGTASALSRMYVTILPYLATYTTQLSLSRRGGMAAPMLGGVLLAMGRSIPVYASVVIFFVAGLCVLMLREDEGEGADKVDDAIVVH